MNGFPLLSESINSENLPVCECLQANIRLYANICKRIFASEYSLECEIRLKFCEYSLQIKYFEENIRQYEYMYLFCNKLNICIRSLRIF